MRTLLIEEASLLVAAIVAVIAYAVEHALLGAGRNAAIVATVVLVAAILLASRRVAHHAELLAEKVGEPYGTMILTLAAVAVEVVILVIVMLQAPSPTLARDTVYSAVMIDMNGLLGAAALVGGLRHGEQSYNVASGNTYVVMILTAVGVSMLMPDFVPDAGWRVYSVFTIVVMALFYGLFLRMQTGAHSYFFSHAEASGGRSTGPDAAVPTAARTAGTGGASASDHGTTNGSVRQSGAVLVLGISLIGALAEVMSKTLGVATEGSGMPPIFTGLLVAFISASPEILTAVRAALANRMQPVVNIALGASLSTVILTVPVIEAVALYTGDRIQMGLTPVQTAMTFLTLLVAGINLHNGATNAIEGMTHFVLFAAFLMLAALV